MKQVFSWALLCFFYVLFGISYTLDLSLHSFVVDFCQSHGVVLRIVVALVGSACWFSFAYLRGYFLLGMSYQASQSICESKTGLRYIVFGVLLPTGHIVKMAIDFNMMDVFFLAMAIGLMIGYASYGLDLDIGE